MAFGERAAIEGLLSAGKPELAIEVGTAEGACLRRIAPHAGEVHSFDLIEPSIPDLPENVRLHTGDSHVLLPQVLAEFAAAGRYGGLRAGRRRPLRRRGAPGRRGAPEPPRRSPTASSSPTTPANEHVRAGLDAVPYGAYPKVAHVDLDFVPGHLGRDRFPGELWYGLGLIVVDAARPAYGSGPAVQTDRHHGGELLAIARDVLAGSRARRR